jgi:hypothetical protein
MAGVCAKHGPQESWTGVCLAIGDALSEQRAVGFVWGVDDTFHWAFCDECQAERLKGIERPHKLVPLCHTCFEEAWELNGKPEKLVLQ